MRARAAHLRAGALLADPRIVMFDEPVNGLDPDGVMWVRRLSRRLLSRRAHLLEVSTLMGSKRWHLADELLDRLELARGA